MSTQLLLHNPAEPLLFNSGTFFLFFSCFVLVFAMLPLRRAVRLLFVLLFSYFYYYKCNGVFTTALLVTTAADYAVARAIARSNRPRLRRVLLGLSIGLSLAILGYFKYANFVRFNLSLFSGHAFTPLSIFLPIGISFYTFQSISYVIDVYRGQLEPTESLLEYAFFLSFFPQIVAGPIVRAREFFHQIRAPLQPTSQQVTEGLFRILLGLLKKALIADYLGSYADLIFDSPQLYGGAEVALGIYAYTWQVYFDFSGYSDLAIGMARVVGVALPENFDAPYRATSIAEFWRRWHMTLSRWVRDYLFLPLSLWAGRRIGLRYGGLVFVMALVGLWHGASYHFILWGLVHGVALALHAWWSRRVPRRPSRSITRAMLGWFCTFHLVAASWVLFRAADLHTARTVVVRLFADWQLDRCGQVLDARVLLLMTMATGGVLALLSSTTVAKLGERFCRVPAPAKALAFLLMVQAVLQVQSSHVQPFIYFQF